MPKLELTYFDSPTSRGEECRLALFVAGVDFHDNRIAREAWAALKPTTPFGCLPVLAMEGKPPVSQSNAILSYVGRNHGLLPADPWEALRLESLLGAVEDLRTAIAKTFGIREPKELERQRAELVEGPLRTFLRNLDQQIQGPFAGGAALSVADLKLFVLLGWLKKGVLDHVPPEVVAPFGRLERLYAAVKEHPKVVEWYARSH